MGSLGFWMWCYTLLGGLCWWWGYRLHLRDVTKPPEVALPRVTVVGAGGANRVSTSVSAAMRSLRKLAIVGLIVGPWLLLPLVVYFLTRVGVQDAPVGGRTLRIGGRARLPTLALGDGWGQGAAAPALGADLPESERQALGAQWLDAARMEHASVPAFAQLSLDLAAVGAPPALLARCHQAALDEIRHAEVCFGLARVLTGEAHTAGRIDALARARTSRVDLTSLAVESLLDGCVGEGVAAAMAAEAARQAEEPAIVAAWTMIARDEAAHAELAWSVVAWCLAQEDPRVTAALTRCVAELPARAPAAPPALVTVAASTRRRYGVLEPATVAALTASCVASTQARARDLLTGPRQVLRAA